MKLLIFDRDYWQRRFRLTDPLVLATLGPVFTGPPPNPPTPKPKPVKEVKPWPST